MDDESAASKKKKGRKPKDYKESQKMDDSNSKINNSTILQPLGFNNP
jgi:hypothetical protein